MFLSVNELVFMFYRCLNPRFWEAAEKCAAVSLASRVDRNFSTTFNRQVRTGEGD